MPDMDHDDKIKFMKMLNWDYLDDHEDMLAVVDGRKKSSGVFTRDILFLRSLERLPWHYITALWGTDAIKKLYTPKIATLIWPKERKKYFDYAIAVLRGDPVPIARWGDEYYKSMWRPLLSDRWYRTKQSIL